MNPVTYDYLMKKMESRRDMPEHERGRGGREDMRDYNDHRDSRDMRDYADGRRSRDYDDRRGRGNIDFEGTMDFRDGRRSRDYGDMRDYRDMRDMRDYGLSLSKSDMNRWKRMLENADGSRGPHYDMQQIMSVAEKMHINFNRDFDEKEFCMVVNMMYADYCSVAKKYVSSDKELMFFADLAKAFLEDEDGPGASEKLALYFHCIVDA